MRCQPNHAVTIPSRLRECMNEGVAKLLTSGAVELNSSVFWVIMRRKLVQNRRFETTYRVPSSRVKLLKRPLKTGTIGTAETSVLNQFTLRNNPEDEVNRTVSRFVSVCSMSHIEVTFTITPHTQGTSNRVGGQRADRPSI
jgi:hypothetical protein